MTFPRGRGRKLAVVALLVIIALTALLAWLPGYVEAARNRVVPAPIPISERARALHARLEIADLHADSLLWARDLSQRADRGHVDLPRLVAGNVGLQVFSIVTRVPRNLNMTRNADDGDQIWQLMLVQRWPPATWFDVTARALYQTQRLQRLAADADNRLHIIRTRENLSQWRALHRRDRRALAGLLAIEGAHALGDDPANFERLYDAGVRMMSPSHLFDSAFAGSAQGAAKTGLSARGRAWLQRMEAARMIVDLAHASPRAVDDILAAATRPVVVSHTGVRGTCEHTRNLSDAQLRALATNGALIGIGFWDTATCGHDARAIARAMRHAARLIGVGHIALGSDFDGTVTTPFDTAGLVELTQALIDEDFTDGEIGSMMGNNAMRFLSRHLP